MNFQFTHPLWLLLLLAAVPWTVWLALRSDAQAGPVRRWVSFLLRLVVVLLVVLSIAGIQWKRPLEGMNVFFVLDRSDSVPPDQQEFARQFGPRVAVAKRPVDRAGVLVFGSDAAIDTAPNPVLGDQKIQAVVSGERTDLASAIRLGTAAFPETGQKRLVVVSDGNENLGDALAAVLAAKPLGVTVDVLPVGVTRGGDVSVQKLGLPGAIKKGQTFEAKIFAQADQPQSAKVRLFQNDQLLGEQLVTLDSGKNLFTFPQTLNEPGFYSYEVQVDATGDSQPRNNRARNFVTVRGNPRVLLVSAEPDKDAPLAAALRSANLDLVVADVSRFPGTLAEMQSYDSIFLSNIAAGDLGQTLMKLLESAVRDFGVGLVTVGGDQAYAAGGYRGTPLEAVLPVDMELSSKKVLPPGAVVLVMHGMEFMNGNQVARDCAIGVLEALGPQDEMGILLWDGTEQWCFPLEKVGDKKAMRRAVAGMNQGDLGSFQNIMSMGHEALKKSKASLKHMIVFSDGDPGAPTPALLQAMVGDKITVSTVLIAGHSGPNTMITIAEQGHGRFYAVQSPNDLPQIFIKEAAVILKSAIHEEPFRPQSVAASELTRGIGGAEYPVLQGYVATGQKPRAETPLLTEKGDPLLAHWQYGLGRAVAFTSDAKARWAQDWLGWARYRQFWSQIGNWSLRRLDSADLVTDVSVDKGEGVISVEALDDQGAYRNFLNLQALVVSPKGDRQSLRLEQTGPGHYEARFPTKDVGAYLINLLDVESGRTRSSQVLGASVNYSPEFMATEPNTGFLRRLAEAGGGRLLDPELPADNPFLHDRMKTFQPRDLWEALLRMAIVLFVIDVAVRRIHLDREDLARAWRRSIQSLMIWKPTPKVTQTDVSLASLLTRRDEVRSRHTVDLAKPRTDLFEPASPVSLPSRKPGPHRGDAVALVTPPGETSPEQAGAKDDSVTSRLLEAKRRARRRQDSQDPPGPPG